MAHWTQPLAIAGGCVVLLNPVLSTVRQVGPYRLRFGGMTGPTASRPSSTEILSASQQIGRWWCEAGIILERNDQPAEPDEGHMGNLG